MVFSFKPIKILLFLLHQNQFVFITELTRTNSFYRKKMGDGGDAPDDVSFILIIVKKKLFLI